MMDVINWYVPRFYEYGEVFSFRVGVSDYSWNDVLKLQKRPLTDKYLYELINTFELTVSDFRIYNTQVRRWYKYDKNIQIQGNLLSQQELLTNYTHVYKEEIKKIITQYIKMMFLEEHA